MALDPTQHQAAADAFPWTSLIGPAVGAACVSAMVASVGGVFSILRFVSERRQSSRMPFLQKQLEMCFQVTDIVARLACETEAVEWEKQRLAFWLLYCGPMCIVEDMAVEDILVDIGNIIGTVGDPVPSLPVSNLDDWSFELGWALRKLLLNSWRVKMPALKNRSRK